MFVSRPVGDVIFLMVLQSVASRCVSFEAGAESLVQVQRERDVGRWVGGGAGILLHRNID